MTGNANVECPPCEMGSYCAGGGDPSERGYVGPPCGSCHECTITEYTPDILAKEPSNCASWDAVMGFRYLPDQCQIVWVVLAILLSPCICCVIAKCYMRWPASTTTTNPGKITVAMDDLHAQDSTALLPRRRVTQFRY